MYLKNDDLYKKHGFCMYICFTGYYEMTECVKEKVFPYRSSRKIC